VHLGEAHLRAGRLDEAGACAARGLALARERGERGHEAWALHLSGAVAGQRRPPEVDTARRRYGESVALAEALGMRPLLAHGRLGLGLLPGPGEAGAAASHLAAAAALYRDLGMEAGRRRAEAALAGAGTPPPSA
jgi:hypothetical protein